MHIYLWNKNKHSAWCQVCWHLMWIFQIHNGAWQNAGAKVQRKSPERIYLHPECIVSRCNKVARAAQLMWRVLCAVYAAASLRHYFHFPRFLFRWPGILFWPLSRTPVFCFHFNTMLQNAALIGRICSANSSKAGKLLAHLHFLLSASTCGPNRRL